MIACTSAYPSIAVSLFRPRGTWQLSGRLVLGQRILGEFMVYPAAKVFELPLRVKS